jgi:hypothetical protein
LLHITKRLARAGLLAAGLVAIPVIAAAAAAGGPAATVKVFLDDFNKGDMARAQAANAADESIVDEIPPHEWHGPGAYQAWLKDLGAASTAAGQTDEKVTYVSTVREQVDGDTAYVVTKVVFTYKLHGKPTVEPAQVASALAKQGGAWKITGWAWAGTVPQPAKR